MKKVICWLLVLLWMIVIFSFSNMNGDLSSNTSNGTIHNVISFIDDIFNLNLDIDSITTTLNGPIRKLAHFSIYFILSIFVIIALSNYDIKLNKKLIITLIICFIYACSDELHQYFISDRSCEFKDILIDSSGSSLFILFYYLKNRK